MSAVKSFINSIVSGLSFAFNIKLLIPFFLLVFLWFVLGYIGLYQILMISFYPFQSTFVPVSTFEVVSGLALFLLMILAFAYCIEVSLLIYEFPKTKFMDILAVSFYEYPKFLISFLIQIVITAFSIVVFVIPSLLLGPLNLFDPIYSLKEGDDPFTAMKGSYALSKSNFWLALSVFLFYLILSLLVLSIIYINFSGNFGLALVLLIIIVPYISIAFYISSHTLFNEFTTKHEEENRRYHTIFRPE